MNAAPSHKPIATCKDIAVKCDVWSVRLIVRNYLPHSYLSILLVFSVIVDKDSSGKYGVSLVFGDMCDLYRKFNRKHNN